MSYMAVLPGSVSIMNLDKVQINESFPESMSYMAVCHSPVSIMRLDSLISDIMQEIH